VHKPVCPIRPRRVHSRLMRLKTVTTWLKTFVGGMIAATIIRLLYASVRWEHITSGEVDRTRDAPAAIFAFWHGRLLMAPGLYFHYRKKRPKGPYMLISSHGDGRLIAFAVRLLGIRSVAGSSTRGGLKALLGLMRCLDDGRDIGFTPDGPKGPRYECKEGVVLAAQKSGRVIYPLSYSVDRKWQLRSWDGMIVPKPFARGVAIVGTPLLVGPDEDREEARLRIQKEMREINEQADRYWSRV